MYKRFPKPQTLNPSRKEQTASCSSLRTRKRKPHCTRPHTTVPGCGLQGLLLVTMLTSVTIVTFTPLINVSTIASIAAIASITTITVITIYYMLFVLLQISQCWYCLLRCVYIYIYIHITHILIGFIVFSIYGSGTWSQHGTDVLHKLCNTVLLVHS